jgi:hypothetical protein
MTDQKWLKQPAPVGMLIELLATISLESKDRDLSLSKQLSAVQRRLAALEARDALRHGDRRIEYFLAVEEEQ